MKKNIKKILIGIFFLLGFISFTRTINAANGYVTITGYNDYDKAQEVLKIVNEEREKLGRDPLTLDTKLTEAAMKRAQEQAVYFSHTRPNLESCFSIFEEYGISYYNAGENIAYGTNNSTSVMEMWMNSEGHKENIINSNYNIIGIGYYSDGQNHYWVQMFINYPDSTPLTKTGKTATQEFKIEVSDGYVLPYYDIYDTRFSASDDEYNILYLGEERNLYYKNNNFYIYNIGTKKPVAIKNTDISLKVEDPSIIKYENGKITALKSGETVITATIGNVKLKYKMLVGSKLSGVTLDSNVEIFVGEQADINLNILPSDALLFDFRYQLDNENIADLQFGDLVNGSSKINVTGLKPGTTTLTIYASDDEGNIKTAKCTIVVKERKTITDVSLDKTKVTLSVNDISKLVATINPTDTTDDKTLLWESSNNDIVTVDQNGNIKALKPGTATISVTTSNGKKASAEIKVLIPIESINISNSEIILNVGESKKVDYTISPTNVEEDTTIIWKSENENIAKVDENGNITAINAGTTTITATTRNGISATLKVTVKIPLEGIKINENNLLLEKGTSKVLSIIYLPNNTTEKPKVKWSSSDNKIATVDEYGQVTAISNGRVTITATASNYQDIIEIEVITPITSISFSEEEITLNKNETKKVEVIVKPDDASSKEISYKSLDEKIASVDNKGNITANSSGTTYIEATIGSKKTTLKVNVITPIEEFKLTENNISIKIGSKYTLKPIISPEDTTENKNIVWETLNQDIISVDSNGIITALKKGQSTLTGTLENGMKVTATINVYDIPITEINVDSEELELYVNEEKKVNVTIKPVDTTDDKIITYENSSDIIIVSSDGTIKGLKAGTAIIRIKVGNITKDIKVTVKDILLEDINITINKTELEVNEETNIIVSPKPTNVTEDYHVSYVSSDDNIATIDEKGKILAISPGTVTITIKTSTGIVKEYQIIVKSTSSESDKEEKPDKEEQPDKEEKPDKEEQSDKEEQTNKDEQSDKEEQQDYPIENPDTMADFNLIRLTIFLISLLIINICTIIIMKKELEK